MLQFNATFLVAIISFVVFIVIMNAIFYKPVLSIMEKREKVIKDNYNAANSSKDTAKSILEVKEKRLEETYKTAKNIIAEENKKANSQAQEIVRSAKINSDNKINEAKENIKNLENNTVTDKAAEEITAVIAEKLLGEA